MCVFVKPHTMTKSVEVRGQLSQVGSKDQTQTVTLGSLVDSFTCCWAISLGPSSGLYCAALSLNKSQLPPSSGHAAPHSAHTGLSVDANRSGLGADCMGLCSTQQMDHSDPTNDAVTQRPGLSTGFSELSPQPVVPRKSSSVCPQRSAGE